MCEYKLYYVVNKITIRLLSAKSKLSTEGDENIRHFIKSFFFILIKKHKYNKLN